VSLHILFVCLFVTRLKSCLVIVLLVIFRVYTVNMCEKLQRLSLSYVLQVVLGIRTGYPFQYLMYVMMRWKIIVRIAPCCIVYRSCVQ